MKLRKKKLQRKLDWWWKGVIDRTTREPIRQDPRWMDDLRHYCLMKELWELTK